MEGQAEGRRPGQTDVSEAENRGEKEKSYAMDCMMPIVFFYFCPFFNLPTRMYVYITYDINYISPNLQIITKLVYDT